MPKLIDLGERKILSELIPKFVNGAGDDCASIQTGTGTILITTDPVPPPAARIIGGDDDDYWLGWLLVTINASDLAAAGAHPLGFVCAIECPAELSVERLERLLLGVREACDAEGLAYCGGNLREADRISAVGTAIGILESGKALTRQGAAAGDLLVSIGAGGLFWDHARAFLNNNQAIDKAHSPIFRPISQLRVMEKLCAAGVVAAAMDNSDGLLPTVSELAQKNNVSAILDISAMESRFREAHGYAMEDVRSWFGWGDWNVITAIRPDCLESAKKVAASCARKLQVIGRFEAGDAIVFLERGDSKIAAHRLESERFSRDSWFSEGIHGYFMRLQNLQLP